MQRFKKGYFYFFFARDKDPGRESSFKTRVAGSMQIEINHVVVVVDHEMMLENVTRLLFFLRWLG